MMDVGPIVGQVISETGDYPSVIENRSGYAEHMMLVGADYIFPDSDFLEFLVEVFSGFDFRPFFSRKSDVGDHLVDLFLAVVC